MGLETGFLLGCLVVVLGAAGLTAFAIYLRAKYEPAQPEESDVELVMQLSAKEDAALEQLADEHRVSKPEVMRKALALYSAVTAAKAA